MTARVYLPLTWAELARLAEDRSLPADLTRLEAESDSEESEYLAMMSAADLSTERQSHLDSGVRRVVVVAELPEPSAPVSWSDLQSVHVDTEDDADPDDDLAWYGLQEIEQLTASR